MCVCDLSSARYATVGFMFQRKGCVRVAVEPGQVEALIDTALEADAEDFEEQNASEESVEIQVRHSILPFVEHADTRPCRYIGPNSS